MPVMTVPLILFCDDLSGNKSKKWNKFIEWDLLIAGTEDEELDMCTCQFFMQVYLKVKEINWKTFTSLPVPIK